MILLLLDGLNAIDPNEQAQRAADAAWESARWALWMLVVTVGLLVGAILAALYAKRTWEATKEQLNMARKADREREASNVSAWLQKAKSGDLVEVFIRNGNGGPVYDVKCRIVAKAAEAEAPTAEVRTEHYVALGPEDAKQVKMYTFNMGPDEYVYGSTDQGVRYTVNRTTKVVFEKSHDWKIWDGEPSTGGLAVDLRFRDSAGQSWHRDWHGRLAEMS